LPFLKRQFQKLPKLFYARSLSAGQGLFKT